MVHRTCRGQYTNQKAIQGKLKKTLKLQSPEKRRQPRSEDSKPKCLFCGKEEKDQKGGGGGGGGTILSRTTEGCANSRVSRDSVANMF